MAKKFVRGITDIKTINNQDLDTNNVNDLLSDGEHSYIHRKKKDGTEEYHNLTNNLKTLEAVDNGLLTVRNFNNTTNSAKLTVHHDQAKSQLLGSPDLTINVQNGENGSSELTTVDVNPAKVLEHDNLLTDYGISKTTSGDTTTLGIQYSQVAFNYDLNNLQNGRVKSSGFTNAPKNSTWFLVSSFSEGNFTVQEAIELINPKNTVYKRTKQDGVWGEWREQSGDKELYSGKETYSHTNATFKTFFKTDGNEEEFNFLAKMNKAQNIADFTLNPHDTAVFKYLIDTYGVDNKINVCGSAFTLNGSNLNFNTNGAQYNPHIINFFDIIPTSATNTQQSAPSRGDTLSVDKVDEILDETVEFDKTDENVEKEQTE